MKTYSFTITLPDDANPAQFIGLATIELYSKAAYHMAEVNELQVDEELPVCDYAVLMRNE